MSVVRRSARVASRGVAAIALVSLGLARVARAEEGPTPEAQAMAAALFDQGRALMEEEKYAEACPRLAESQRLDPGGGTLLNLAECRRREGKTATAHALFAEALAVARRDRRDDRIEVCKAALAELAPKLANVRLVVPARARVPGLVVRLAGVAVPEVAFGTPLAVDPGDVPLEVSAPKYVTQVLVARATDGASVDVDVPVLAPRPPERTSPPAPPPAPRAPENKPVRPLALTAMARLDVDGAFRGAVAYVGIGVRLADVAELSVGPLLGATSGFEAGLRALLPTGRVRPYATLGVPVFVRDVPRAGLRAGAGVEVGLVPHLALAAQASFVGFPEPGALEGKAFVPAVAAVGVF
ncbi:MAG: tetratricopeptide repeat protein [Polyangiaceae bacterium]